MASFRGFFGKLPARGDFVSAGLPRGFVARWDAWISATLPAALAAIGDGWLEVPARRFRLPPGVYTANAVTGMVLPSIDKVGRRFPLTLGWAEDDVDIDAAERLGRAAIEGAMPPNTLAERLARIRGAGDGEAVAPVLASTVTFATMITGGVP